MWGERERRFSTKKKKKEKEKEEGVYLSINWLKLSAQRSLQ